jgi:LmbE family N-acetylglucosaminyl deacetylase
MTERVLVVAAHPDDETFGCGATIAMHAKRGDAVSVLILADGIGSRGFSQALLLQRHGACRKACRILGTEDVWLFQFADNLMDNVALLQVVQHIEKHIERFKPTAIYTHSRGDLNIDHQVTHDAVNVACRPQPGCPVKQLFYFEVPCSTTWGGEFRPTHFVQADLAVKLEAVKCYEGELRESPHPRSYDGIQTLARWRGMSVGMGPCEAFEVGRIVT